jgi:hypothetical protein
MSFTDPIVGGESKLIRSAIQSPNYIAGISGWTINRDGSVEFNNALIRGSVSAGGGVVLLDATGVTVQSTSTLEIYKISRTGGFVAARNPDDGSKVQISAAGVFVTPADPSPLGVGVEFVALYTGYDNPGAANENPFAVLKGVEYTGKSAPYIDMRGQAANDANPDNTSVMNLVADDINFNVGSTQPGYERGEYGSVLVSFGPLAGASIVVNYAKTYTTPPLPKANIDTAPASTARWCTRCIARSTTGFTIFLFAADAVASTWVNVPVSWETTEQH